MDTAQLVATYHWILCIASAGLVIGTFETLSILKTFERDGLFSWRIIGLRASTSTGAGAARRIFDALGSTRAIRLICYARLVAIMLVMYYHPTTWPNHVGVLAILFTLLFSTWRRLLGDDGSDQMNVIVFASAGICSWHGASDRVLELGLWFIALQSCLSYFAAGIAKLPSIQWRSGGALQAIWDTQSYGMDAAVRVLKGVRFLGPALCWAVILFEILFPFSLLAGTNACLAFLSIGALFHLSCAVIMGLNSFLWAFLATYPAVFFICCSIQR